MEDNLEKFISRNVEEFEFGSLKKKWIKMFDAFRKIVVQTTRILFAMIVKKCDVGKVINFKMESKFNSILYSKV